MNDHRLFIVANRLPVCINDTDDKPTVSPASGGLVTAIQSYLNAPGEANTFSEVIWAGVPGCSTPAWEEAAPQIPNTGFTYLPVMVSAGQYEAYYNGFSNSVLWPLFHYFPSFVEYSQEDFDQYLAVNTQFADTLLRHCRSGDTVWIHDYHLLPLAAELRRRLPGLSIGFFLHIPFPSYEVFRLLPGAWQKELLEGMLGADLIGFHTIDYAAHFLQSVQKILGLDSEKNLLRYTDRLIKVDVFPISIDYNRFHEAYDYAEVKNIRAGLEERMKDCRIIFSVDRLDYTKGVQNRLRAYEQFLNLYPQYREHVVFIMNIVPSRDAIMRYAERKRMIDEMIGRINSHYGSLNWQPIIYRYQSLGFEEMVALYSTCDVALITPLRDGMNLVSKEFVASRKDKRGVLIISEMAGAARELSEGLVINPNDINEMAHKINEALCMNIEEQAKRMEVMQHRIRQYDVQAWATDFMSGLEQIRKRQQSFREMFLDDFSRRRLLDSFRSAESRLLLLDYDGTLVSYASRPELAAPGKDLLFLLGQLSLKQGTDVYLISGRSSSWLQQYFGHLPVHLVAEHGACYRRSGEEWITDIETHIDWSDDVLSVMERFVRRCPGTHVEQKEFSLVWHYRNAEQEQGKLRAMELKSELHDYLRHPHLEVLAGNKIVEVRNKGVDKGMAIKKILARKTYDFIFAAGDDKTDEDMFRVLSDRENCFTIKVGGNASYAQFNLLRPQMVVSLLEALDHLPVFPSKEIRQNAPGLQLG